MKRIFIVCMLAAFTIGTIFGSAINQRIVEAQSRATWRQRAKDCENVISEKAAEIESAKQPLSKADLLILLIAGDPKKK